MINDNLGAVIDLLQARLDTDSGEEMVFQRKTIERMVRQLHRVDEEWGTGR